MPDLLHALLSIEPDVVVQFCALTMIALIFRVPSIPSTYKSDRSYDRMYVRVFRIIIYMLNIDHWPAGKANIQVAHPASIGPSYPSQARGTGDPQRGEAGLGRASRAPCNLVTCARLIARMKLHSDKYSNTLGNKKNTESYWPTST